MTDDVIKLSKEYWRSGKYPSTPAYWRSVPSQKSRGAEQLVEPFNRIKETQTGSELSRKGIARFLRI